MTPEQNLKQLIDTESDNEAEIEAAILATEELADAMEAKVSELRDLIEQADFRLVEIQERESDADLDDYEDGDTSADLEREWDRP